VGSRVVDLEPVGADFAAAPDGIHSTRRAAAPITSSLPLTVLSLIGGLSL
jgi:hypothetical protein